MWNKNRNLVNYVKIDQTDDSGNFIGKTIAYFVGKGDSLKDNTLSLEEIGYSSNVGFVTDKLLFSPINVFTTNIFQLNQNEMIQMTNKRNNSIVKVTTEDDGDLSSLKGNLYAYNVISSNPVEKSFEEELALFEKKFLTKEFIDSLTMDISSKSTAELLIDKLKTEKLWERLNLPDAEKKLILSLVGLKFNDLNLFYLYRDMFSLGNKYKNFFSVLSEKYSDNGIFKLINFLWTSPDARANVLSSENIISESQLSQLTPQLKSFSGVTKATIYSINQMKNLISDIDISNKKIRIKMEGKTGWEELDISNFPYKKIKTKNEWDKFIDDNSELLTLMNVYEDIKKWTNQEITNKNIREVSFQSNVLDIYSLNGKLNLSLDYNNFNPILVTFLIFLFSSIGLFINYRLYLRKDVK